LRKTRSSRVSQIAYMQFTTPRNAIKNGRRTPCATKYSRTMSPSAKRTVHSELRSAVSVDRDDSDTLTHSQSLRANQQMTSEIASTGAHATSEANWSKLAKM